MENTVDEAGKVKERKAILQFTYNLQNLREFLSRIFVQECN
jgi:hypothetical protein